MRTYCASAPGKILWLGGYSVLERGSTSLVTVVNKRVHAKAEPIAGNKIVFDAPQLGISLEGVIRGGKLILKGKKENAEKAKFVIAAARNVLKYLHSKGKKITGMKISTVSEGAFGTGVVKTGLGSSAAVTVASTAAILGAHGQGVQDGKSKLVLHNLSQLSHSEAQGKVGSGFDVAAAVHGNIAYSRYAPQIMDKIQRGKGRKFAEMIEHSWDYSDEPISLPQEFIPVVAFTGVPVSTSAMVKKVSDYKRKRGHYSALIREISAADREAVAALKAMREMRENNFREYRAELLRIAGVFYEFRQHFNDARLLTKKLGEVAGAGIEGPTFTKLIQLSLSNGAYVCRLPGAGGGDSIAAICLKEGDAAKLKGFWKKMRLKIMDLEFGDEGVREEPGAEFGKIRKTNVF